MITAKIWHIAQNTVIKMLHCIYLYIRILESYQNSSTPIKLKKKFSVKQ